MSQHCWMFLWRLLNFSTKRKVNKTSFTQRNQFCVVWKLQESCKKIWIDWWRLQIAMFGRFESFFFFYLICPNGCQYHFVPLYFTFHKVNFTCTHYEKLHPLKPHYLATKIQNTTHIQLLCNYFLGITTNVQLSA
jgi:hypothetical protein